MRRSPFLPVALLVALMGSPARAVEPRDAAAADALFRRAKELQAAGELEQACALYGESFRLDRATGTLLNLAACEEAQGKFASAWQHFVDARASLAPGDFRISFADKRIDALAPRVPRLTVSLSAQAVLAKARVFRGELELGAPSLGVPLPTDPGSHVLLVRAPNHKDAKLSFVLAEAERKTLVLDLGSPEEANRTVSALGTPRGASSPPERSSGVRTAGFVTLGAGAAGVATGGILALVARANYEDARAACDGGASDRCGSETIRSSERAYDLAALATATMIAGGVAAAAGGGLLLLVPGASQTTPPTSSSTRLLFGATSLALRRSW